METYVGRSEALKELKETLLGERKRQGKLTIQSIDGPGGIGKTALFDHVLSRVDLEPRKYLTLRISGNDETSSSTFRTVIQLANSATATSLPNKPPGYYFPTVNEVFLAYENICREAISDLEKDSLKFNIDLDMIMGVFDFAIAAGKPINTLIPKTKEYLNADFLATHREDINALLKKLPSIVEESATFLEKLSISKGNSLRNAIKHNALEPLAEALISDLTTILSGYIGTDFLKPKSKKIEGVDRLLVVFDDYEKLQGTLGDFLIGHLLPKLKKANFESTVVVMVRDQLGSSHVAWDQSFGGETVKKISLTPLSRSEMDELVAKHGIVTKNEMNRVWRDTEGYPFYVQLWLEETNDGGRSAVMLKRFHDRTTRWMNKQQKRWLGYTLFLDSVDRRSLKLVLGTEDEANDAYEWFENEGSIRDTTSSAFRVRPYLCSRLLDYLKISDPDLYDELKLSSEKLIISNSQLETGALTGSLSIRNDDSGSM